MKNITQLSLLISIFAILPTILFGQQTMSRKEYIEKYKDIAIGQMKSHGIPASITLAQGCLESGNGNSTLATKANNHFGIKCHNDWKGPSIRIDDDEKNECFRKYRKAQDSFDDHGDFLRYRDRYAFLFDLPITDYKGWAFGLKKAGYATNPQYAQMLIKIIEDEKLFEYDSNPDKKRSKTHNFIPPSPSQLQAIKELKPVKSSPLYKFSLNRTLYVQNGTAYIISNENDTYRTIAKEYNLFLREILSFNDLKEAPETLPPGTVVYIEKKRAKGQKHLDIHIVEEGDTYYGISQRYAVQLDKIYKYNGLTSSSVPKDGDEILLKKPKRR